MPQSTNAQTANGSMEPQGKLTILFGNGSRLELGLNLKQEVADRILEQIKTGKPISDMVLQGQDTKDITFINWK